MGLRKEIIKLQDQMQQLNDFVKGDAEKKEIELKELKKNISNISLKVKKISSNLLENGEEYIRIEYEAPSVTLMKDEKGEIMFNPTFYAINILDLIDKEDFKKISKALEKLQKTKK